MVASGVLGIVVPVVVNYGAAMAGDAVGAVGVVVIQLVGLAVVPVLVARVAYRQGYDRGAAGRAAVGE